jgi:hypothetical protein
MIGTDLCVNSVIFEPPCILSIKDMILMGVRDFTWVSGFPSLGIKNPGVPPTNGISLVLDWLLITSRVFPLAVRNPAVP